jgi:hypothetical protein
MRTRPDIHRPHNQARILSALLIAVALVVPLRSPLAAPAPVAAESTVVLQTAGAPFLEGTTVQPVNDNPGNQTNPHLDCNLASYTLDDFQGSSTVHYHDLATGADNVVPGNQVDLLSDISDSRVAYTEVTFDGDSVRIFDTIAQTQTIVPGLWRSNPSIGGNLVAFEDRSVSRRLPQIAVYDLNTGTVTPLTNDSLINWRPSTSPNGDAVVWEKCQTNELDCAVYAATQTAPGVFTTRALTEMGGRNHLPFTDGQIAVYVSDKSGENDIYYQALAGGSEVHLSIPGNQRWPTVSGDLISFESQDQNNFDIFVYDIRTGKLFRVTDTPDVSETLSEINVCNGAGRIVYSIPGVGSFDVYSVTFQVPAVAEEEIGDLIGLVRGFNLPPGTANSLITKLQSALAALNAGDNATACVYLTSFINECAAQSGKKLTPAQATQLINAANAIKAEVCGAPASAQVTQLAQSATVTQKPASQVKTNTPITYHNGPIVTGTPGVYVIWYGTWDDTAANLATQTILADFLSNVGGSPYFQINAMYPNGSGGAPSGGLLYAGGVVDRYSHGLELTASDIAGIVADEIVSNGLPQDPSGIYVVLASADVSSNSTGFCAPSVLPLHGTGEALGSQFRYAFLGNPNRCPSVAAPQFFSGNTQLPTPNQNLAADAMASNLAQVLSRVITNPTGGAWFDKYGLENASKCVGQFGSTYLTANGARANLKLGGRDYLIQQNWVNDRKAHCAMNSSL